MSKWHKLEFFSALNDIDEWHITLVNLQTFDRFKWSFDIEGHWGGMYYLKFKSEKDLFFFNMSHKYHKSMIEHKQ